jgi:hypothetical protein
MPARGLKRFWSRIPWSNPKSYIWRMICRIRRAMSRASMAFTSVTRSKLEKAPAGLLCVRQ